MAATVKGRETLRGVGEQVLDLICRTCTPEQWAALLKAPLELAATNGAGAVAHKLVDAGAAMGVAVHAAVREGHGAIADFLLESGASTATRDANGDTPLHVAAIAGKPSITRSLLFKGADKNARGRDGRTPLHYAAKHGRVTVTETLLAAGADLNLRFGDDEISPLDTAAGEGHLDVLKAMIEHGADVDAASPNGRTALIYAVSQNKVGAIDVLVGAGAKLAARDVVGRAALHHAAHRPRHFEAALCLLNLGAEANALTNLGQAPLHYAAAQAGKKGTADMVDLLIRWGADETIADKNNQKALDIVGSRVREEARLEQDLERVRKLLANAPAWRRAHPDRSQVGGDWTGLAARVLGLAEEGLLL
ncbi:unnamed protein product [Scytosiphon promiscuus]